MEPPQPGPPGVSYANWHSGGTLCAPAASFRGGFDVQWAAHGGPLCAEGYRIQ